MDEQFKDKGNSLGYFIEECAEALVAAGKTARYGWDSYNPLPEASRETNIVERDTIEAYRKHLEAKP